MIGRTQAKGYAAGGPDLYRQRLASPPTPPTTSGPWWAQGVISGYSDGSFKPHSNITRGQMAKILYNLM